MLCEGLICALGSALLIQHLSLFIQMNGNTVIMRSQLQTRIVPEVSQQKTNVFGCHRNGRNISESFRLVGQKIWACLKETFNLTPLFSHQFREHKTLKGRIKEITEHGL